jgi:hypothetical protein
MVESEHLLRVQQATSILVQSGSGLDQRNGINLHQHAAVAANIATRAQRRREDG